MSIRYEVQNDELIVRIDVSETAITTAPLSQTGKTHLVASTHGSKIVTTPHGDLRLALNLMSRA